MTGDAGDFGRIPYFQPLVMPLLPTHIPRNDAASESSHPPQMSIHNDVTQKVGSTTAAMMPVTLHISGTYQMLLGFCLTIK